MSHKVKMAAHIYTCFPVAAELYLLIFYYYNFFFTIFFVWILDVFWPISDFVFSFSYFFFSLLLWPALFAHCASWASCLSACVCLVASIQHLCFNVNSSRASHQCSWPALTVSRVHSCFPVFFSCFTLLLLFNLYYYVSFFSFLYFYFLTLLFIFQSFFLSYLLFNHFFCLFFYFIYFLIFIFNLSWHGLASYRRHYWWRKKCHIINTSSLFVKCQNNYWYIYQGM